MRLGDLFGVCHVVELRGHRVEFVSAGFKGSQELWLDAIEALKREGLYERAEDSWEMRIDGRRYDYGK